MGKVIVITGGTGGIGYQAALMLAQKPEQHTVVVTGRSKESGEKAVSALKEASGNGNIQYAVADLSVQAQVLALAEDLLQRFPTIDELINNAGNLSTGEKETTVDGLDKNFAVNVVAPLMLSRALKPALEKAKPVGRVQITSGGMPFDTLKVDDIEANSIPVGIPNYSHSKRVMECMALSLSKELAPIPVNVVGGALPGATSMTAAMSFKDMPLIMKIFYPILKLFVFREDSGKSAKKCAEPVVWAATQAEMGTGQSLLSAPKVGAFKPEVTNPDNQETVMKYIESKIVAK